MIGLNTWRAATQPQGVPRPALISLSILAASIVVYFVAAGGWQTGQWLAPQRSQAKPAAVVRREIPRATIRYVAGLQIAVVLGEHGVGLRRPVQINTIARRNGRILVNVTIVPVGHFALGYQANAYLDPRTLRLVSLRPYNAAA